MPQMLSFRRLSGPLFLAGLLLFQAAGWQLAWTYRQSEARRNAARVMELDQTAFRHVTLHTTQFQKARLNRKEVRLEGKLYDIRTLRIKGDSVCLELYHDHHEEHLLHRLTKLLTAGHNHSDQLLGNWLAKIVGQAFLPALPTHFPVVFGEMEHGPAVFRFFWPLSLDRTAPPHGPPRQG